MVATRAHVEQTPRMSLKIKETVWKTIILFVTTAILSLIVRYRHEILIVNYAKPNQKLGFVRYNIEFATTVMIVSYNRLPIYLSFFRSFFNHVNIFFLE